MGRGTNNNLDIAIDAAVSQYRRAVAPVPIIDLGSRVSERTNRAVLAIALSKSPTYTGAAHLLPFVDAYCELAGIERLVDADPGSETSGEALCQSMVGIDLTLSEARQLVSRVVRGLSALSGDACNIVQLPTDTSIRKAVESFFRGDPCQCQYCLECLDLDVRALPSGGSTNACLNLGLVHFTEGLFGFDHLREKTWEVLSTHPTDVWHAVQFLSDAVCDSHLSCTGCACSQTCPALASGWI